MAIQFTDFSRAPLNTQESPLSSVFENILKGYKMSQEPAKMKQEATQRELANKLKGLEVEHKPKEYALGDQQKSLANALQSKALEHYEEKFQMSRDLNKARIDKLNNKATTDIVKPNGKVANIAWVKKQLEDPNIDPQYAAQLQQALKDEQEKTEASTDRSKILNATQDQRSQTQQGKLLSEAKDVDDGFVPGTGRKQKMDNPEMQKFYKDQYALKLQKERSDSVTRNRAIYAGLVDNTFDSINVDKLVQYSGIEGTIDKYAAKHQLVPEDEMAKYREYKEEQAKVQVLAKQIRQFYGDSISPGNLKKLEEISNPATWSESPAAAKAQFEAFKKIVKQETGIYRNALKTIAPFQEQQSGGSSGSFDFSKYPVAGGR